MDRLRFVVDTNVLVSALCFPRSVPRQAFDRASERGYLLLSQNTILEAEEVLVRDRFDRYITREERRRFWQALVRKAILVTITEAIAACRDPKDDKFLEVAINGRANVIITGDDDLKVLHPFRGVPILKPEEFLGMELPQ